MIVNIIIKMFIIIIITAMEWKRSEATWVGQAAREVTRSTGWFPPDPMITCCPLSGDNYHDSHDEGGDYGEKLVAILGDDNHDNNMIIHEIIMVVMINLAEVRHQRCHQLEAKPQTMIFHLLHMIAGHIHHVDHDDDIDEMCWKHKSNNNDNVQVTSVLNPLSQ